ncbi:MAG: hypothetical protein ACE5JI_17640 [Acidobacteriota bacterium]
MERLIESDERELVMEDAGADLRRIVNEELATHLAEMERREIEEGHISAAPRLLTHRLARWGEMVGALLLGLLCGILSHAGVVLLARTLQ